MKSFRKQFLIIFAISLVATLLLCPGNYSVPGGIRDNICPVEVQAEEPTITDTQKGVALLMTILFAQGLRFVGDWHNVVEPGIEKLWNDFTTATGNAVTLPMIVAGSSLALGYIRTSNTVNNAIANFTAWYKQTFSQPTTGEISVPVSTGGQSYMDLTKNVCTQIATFASGNRYMAIANEDSRVLCFTKSGSNYLYTAFCSMSAFGCDVRSTTGTSCAALNTGSSSVLIDGVRYYYAIKQLSVSNLSGVNYICPHVETSVNLGVNNDATGREVVFYTYGEGAIADLSMTGESLELKDGYQLEQDQAKLYDISALTALVGELALTLDNIEDLVRDIPVIFDTPWAEDFPDVPAYVDTPDDTIPWVTVPDSVIPADTPEYVPTTPGDTDSYKILGLERVFPFSIPFDLYYLTQIFVATPETPHFTYAIMNPATNQLLTQEFDLHWFDTLAAVIRTGETVAFLIFLIFVTRGLIRS